MAKNGYKYVNPENFVKAWQSAKSVDDLMHMTGMNRIACYQRANYYRVQGVPLKRMPKGRKKLDIHGLTTLAKKYAR